jgi:hypothetical protein
VPWYNLVRRLLTVTITVPLVILFQVLQLMHGQQQVPIFLELLPETARV